METVAEGNDEANFDDITVAKTSSASSSPREMADSVVYKLVRVDGDGKLVPATDDELMEVEDFLEDVKPVGDSGQNVTCTRDDEIPSSGQNVTCTHDELMEVEGFLEELHPVGDNGQNITCTPDDEIPSGQCEDPEVVVEKESAQQDADGGLEESNAQTEEIFSSSAAESNDNHVNQSGSGGEYSNSVDETSKSGSSGAAACTGSKPDFSKLQGKICLDSLSVRELHETFRATFGRETSVKDKQWLKRRIAMGLSNSCDVSSMTFVIEGGKVVKIVQEESLGTDDGNLVKDLVVGGVNEKYGGFPMGRDDQPEDPNNISGKRLRNPSAGRDCSSKGLQNSLVAAKRVRKPTKRYIEELSEVESRENNGNLIFPSKNFGLGHSSLKAAVRPVSDVQSDWRPLVTRRDSLGGSGVRVPYVCRVRRSRPRENYVTFMKLQPGGMGMTTKLVQEALGSCGPRLDNEIESKVFSDGADSVWIQKPLIGEPEKENLCQERETCEPEKEKLCQERETCEPQKDIEPIQWDPSGENSDNYTPNVATAKGGIRRKHHLPWSLSEVVKLVEGVARYGAGRWSEIKRLAFASHSYRTSVDLKDKWRNLLRASFSQSAAEKGNSRKQVSVPIPAQILVRVRELAEMQAQVPPNLSSSKFNGRNVHETSPGYL